VRAEEQRLNGPDGSSLQVLFGIRGFGALARPALVGLVNSQTSWVNRAKGQRVSMVEKAGERGRTSRGKQTEDRDEVGEGRTGQGVPERTCPTRKVLPVATWEQDDWLTVFGCGGCSRSDEGRETQHSVRSRLLGGFSRCGTGIEPGKRRIPLTRLELVRLRDRWVCLCARTRVSFNESVTPTKPKTLFVYLLKRLMSLMSRDR
jgi:hypothetical protein